MDVGRTLGEKKWQQMDDKTNNGETLASKMKQRPTISEVDWLHHKVCGNSKLVPEGTG